MKLRKDELTFHHLIEKINYFIEEKKIWNFLNLKLYVQDGRGRCQENLNAMKVLNNFKIKTVLHSLDTT